MRLIDADALIEMCENPFVDFIDMDDVRNAPTIDAVPVSYIYKRAMELKNDDMMYAYTVLNSLIANYCADGERKDGEHD